MVQSPFTKAALALLVGSLLVARTATSPIEFVGISVATAVPTFLLIEFASHIFGSMATRKTTNRLWTAAFVLTLLVIGAGLGMILASSLGWSRQPESIRYSLTIVVVAVVSLLIGFYSTAHAEIGRGT